MQQEHPPDFRPLEAHLGFGSLHFQVTESAPRSFTGREYLDWIERELRQLPAATVIEIQALDTAYLDGPWDAPAKSERYIDSGIPYPPLEFCRLKFALEIPAEAQAEVLGEDDHVSGVGAETFVVSIQDGWQMPVAMVWPFGAKSRGDGSNAVRIVREYLRRKVGYGQSPPLAFDCLGPSPAHFTIQLTQGKPGQENAFEMVRREADAYPNYIFAYSPRFTDIASAVDELHFELNPQLDFIYRVASARVSQLHKWGKAEDRARRILNAYESKGPRGSFHRLVQGRNIGRSQIALVELELDQTLDHKRLWREFEAEYVDTPEVNIDQVAHEQLKGFETIEVEPLSRLLEALAASRQTARAVLIAAVASLIGAVVAAVATLVAS